VDKAKAVGKGIARALDLDWLPPERKINRVRENYARQNLDERAFPSSIFAHKPVDFTSPQDQRSRLQSWHASIAFGGVFDGEECGAILQQIQWHWLWLQGWLAHR